MDLAKAQENNDEAQMMNIMKQLQKLMIRIKRIIMMK
jgi:hypothetical protein